MTLRRTDIVVLGAGFVTALLLATDFLPGVRGPENWRWGRRVLEAPHRLAAVVALWAALVVVARQLRIVWRTQAVARRILLALAAVVVFLQMLALTNLEPGGLSNIARRVMDPSFTSYHTIAGDVGDPVDFLRRYHLVQARLLVHGSSQPPGRVLFFWTVNRLSTGSGPERFWLWLGERLGGVPPGRIDTTEGERAGAVAAGFLLIGIGALSVVPLALLAGGRNSGGSAAAGVLLFGGIPSVLLFTPQTDHLILATSLGSAAFVVEAIRSAGNRRSLVLALAGGLAGSLGVFVSFTTLAALAAWGLAIASWLLLAQRRSVPVISRRKLLTIAGGSFLGLLSVPALTSLLGMNWPAVFREATSAAHRVQVMIHGREYSTWVVWNLWDFALFLGPPLSVLTIVAAKVELAAIRHARTVEIPAALALLVALAALDSAGTILGETGRIWMFFMPLAAVSTGRILGERPLRAILPLATSQLIVLLAVRSFLHVPG